MRIASRIVHSNSRPTRTGRNSPARSLPGCGCTRRSSLTATHETERNSSFLEWRGFVPCPLVARERLSFDTRAVLIAPCPLAHESTPYTQHALLIALPELTMKRRSFLNDAPIAAGGAGYALALPPLP